VLHGHQCALKSPLTSNGINLSRKLPGYMIPSKNGAQFPTVPKGKVRKFTLVRFLKFELKRGVNFQRDISLGNLRVGLYSKGITSGTKMPMSSWGHCWLSCAKS